MPRSLRRALDVGQSLRTYFRNVFLVLSAVEPATGERTVIPPREEPGWVDTPTGSYGGVADYTLSRTFVAVAAPCHGGLHYGDEPVDPDAGINDSALPLTYTPRGVLLLCDRSLSTGEPLKLACQSFRTRGVPSSPSGRYALIRGNLVDFDPGQAWCWRRRRRVAQRR